MRKQLILALTLVALDIARASADGRNAVLLQGSVSNETQGENWALLIAGSNGWGNYRHQADVAHAYQVLLRGGIKEDRIIVMMFDDVARHPMNPHPNKLFNAPGGPDVYQGLRVDYSGTAVNALNFLAVLAGNRSGIEVSSIANGRVLESGPQDHVFVYYSDHGAPGIVGMPSGPFLFADQWLSVIKSRSGVGYEHMVIYLEACESGSMFEGLLPEDISVFATTAANARESSWGTYCPGQSPSPPPELLTCLGDLYSVAWLEDADEANLSVETLKEQFQAVRLRTSQNFTYQQGSHAQRFGQLSMGTQSVAEYLGDAEQGPAAWRHAGAGAWVGAQVADAGAESSRRRRLGPQGAVPQRDADLAPLYAAVWREGPANSAKRAEAERALAAALGARAALDARVARAVGAVADGRRSAARQGAAGRKDAPSAGLGAAPAFYAPDLLYAGELPGREGRPVVDDWDCLRDMVGAWESVCGALDQYGMRHSRAFANLCNAGVRPSELGTAAALACTDADVA
ncbi:VPE1 [Auxenochlorella protothecoides x Auxenochlorella symbiontica]